MPQGAYVLAIGSHKGGTGRSTAAMALAWGLGQIGLDVLLVDMAPTRTGSLVAVDASGQCPWPNVAFSDHLPSDPHGDVVIVDTPPLLEPTALDVLIQADGLILTCLADPLSLRTIPAAAAVVVQARERHPGLELIGILLAMHDHLDEVQSAMLGQLRRTHGHLLLEPPVPYQRSWRDWPLLPGSEPPEGPAREAYQELARLLEPIVRVVSAV